MVHESLTIVALLLVKLLVVLENVVEEVLSHVLPLFLFEFLLHPGDLGLDLVSDFFLPLHSLLVFCSLPARLLLGHGLLEFRC